MRMQKLTLAALATAFLALGGTARADDMNAQANQPAHPGDAAGLRHHDMASDAAREEAMVKVVKVDSKNHKVRFEAQVQPEANVMENGQPIRFDQLHEGDDVRATFDPNTGEVNKLEVVRPKR